MVPLFSVKIIGGLAPPSPPPLVSATGWRPVLKIFCMGFTGAMIAIFTSFYRKICTGINGKIEFGIAFTT